METKKKNWIGTYIIIWSDVNLSVNFSPSVEIAKIKKIIAIVHNLTLFNLKMEKVRLYIYIS